MSQPRTVLNESVVRQACVPPVALGQMHAGHHHLPLDTEPSCFAERRPNCNSVAGDGVAARAVFSLLPFSWLLVLVLVLPRPLPRPLPFGGSIAVAVQFAWNRRVSNLAGHIA